MCTQGIYDRYVNFYTDFAFKKLFGTEVNKELLISFLNALLKGREEIQDISYLNTEHLGTQEYDRRAVFDVYCTNERGEYLRANSSFSRTAVSTIPPSPSASRHPGANGITG